jgi:hypothetical protein
MYPWCPISERNCCIYGPGAGCVSIKKKGGPCRPLVFQFRNRYFDMVSVFAALSIFTLMT